MKGVWVFVLFLLFTFSAYPACDLSSESDGWDVKKSGTSDDDDDDCTDNDDDGWCEEEDCNDYDKNVNPGVLEDCFDLIDNDCDFLVDEDDTDCPDANRI